MKIENSRELHGWLALTQWLRCYSAKQSTLNTRNLLTITSIELVTYTPYQGFPAYFYPYYNQLGYLQPIVMVQLKNPTPGVLVNTKYQVHSLGEIHWKDARYSFLWTTLSIGI